MSIASKAEKRQARRERKVKNTKRLTDEGIEFTSHGDGLHLILWTGGKRIDFWPSTEKWVVQLRFSKTRHGIDELIDYVRSGGLKPAAPTADSHVPGTMIS